MDYSKHTIEISSKVEKTNLPDELILLDHNAIGEALSVEGTNHGPLRVLFEPSEAYNDDAQVNIAGIAATIVERYNRHTPKIEWWQAHHQNKADRTQMFWIAQIELDANHPAVQKYFKEWMDDLQGRFPPPAGWEWFMCNERNEHFVKCDPSTYKEVTDE